MTDHRLSLGLKFVALSSAAGPRVAAVAFSQLFVWRELIVFLGPAQDQTGIRQFEMPCPTTKAVAARKRTNNRRISVNQSDDEIRGYEWKQVARFSMQDKSEEDVQWHILQTAKDQLQPWIPASFVDLKNLDTDLYSWKRKETYCKSKGMFHVTGYR